MAQIDVTDHGLDCLMVGSVGGDDDGVVVQMWACQWRWGTTVVLLQAEEIWTFASIKDHQDHCWKQENVQWTKWWWVRLEELSHWRTWAGTFMSEMEEQIRILVLGLVKLKSPSCLRKGGKEASGPGVTVCTRDNLIPSLNKSQRSFVTVPFKSNTRPEADVLCLAGERWKKRHETTRRFNL